jgi:cation transport ATPase
VVVPPSAASIERVQPRFAITARRFGPRLLVGIALLGLSTGGWFWWRGEAGPSDLAWTLGTLPVLLALFGQIIASLRRSDVGLDIVAALSMSAALIFGETLAANVVALMYAGGQLLESFAEGRARREMTALLGRVACPWQSRGEGTHGPDPGLFLRSPEHQIPCPPVRRRASWAFDRHGPER